MARNILVVEDDRNISDLIQMYLVKEGFEVRIAADGGKAIAEFQKSVPDLILLDIMLPVMDGWAVCAKIRETSKVPIIMLTAKSEVFDRIQGLEMGAPRFRDLWPASADDKSGDHVGLWAHENSSWAVPSPLSPLSSLQPSNGDCREQ